MVFLNNNSQKIIDEVLKKYIDVQAIYLFGSVANDAGWPSSDVDIALLLPDKTAEKTGSLIMSSLRFKLESLLKWEVDLVNLRIVSTVFQKEIIAADKRIFCADQYAADEFEMLTLSYYQKLNEERKEILEEFYKTKRAYNV